MNAQIGIYEFNFIKHYTTKPRQNRDRYIRNTKIILRWVTSEFVRTVSSVSFKRVAFWTLKRTQLVYMVIACVARYCCRECWIPIAIGLDHLHELPPLMEAEGYSASCRFLSPLYPPDRRISENRHRVFRKWPTRIAHLRCEDGSKSTFFLLSSSAFTDTKSLILDTSIRKRAHLTNKY